MAERKKIILDVDPGHDDAAAIMLAYKNPAIELKAITVVAGNQTLEKTVRNTLNVCSAVGIHDVPIAAGMDRPLLRNQLTELHIHGESGLEGPNFGEPTVTTDPRHAVQLIIDTLMESEGDITVVPTGPFTNIAMAIRMEPRIVPKIKRFVVMGGAYGVGNKTPAAEFNVLADPEAAYILFTAGRPITMMGLDLTRQALALPFRVAKIRSLGNRAAILFAELMEYFASTQKAVFGWEGPPLHDPTTVAWLIDPGCVETRPMHVDIELNGRHTYGRTVCDYFNILKLEPNADVAVTLDAEKFWNILYDTYALYS